MPGVNGMLFPAIVSKVLSTAAKHGMFAHGDRILIGLSGGPDSVCLLHILATVRGKYNLGLHALSIDHQLRPGETEKETAFCRRICEQYDMPFTAQSIDVKSYAQTAKLNIQEAARQLRYRAYEETSCEINANKIALGHTADDQAETLLMHLLRGSGTTGLAGIPPVRKNIIRPLIEIERKEIEDFLTTTGIDSIIDSSNTKKDYVRNRVRLSLMPMLREFNPDITGTLSKTAAIFRDEERYFEILVTKALMKLISRKTETRIELFLAPFGTMDKVIMRRVLRRAVDATRGLRGITFIHIEDMVSLIRNGAPGDRLYLPGGIRVIKDYATVILTSEAPIMLNPCTLNLPGETILKEAGILIKASEAEFEESGAAALTAGLSKSLGVFDADILQFPLTARPRKDGDFFYPLGFGKRKKLQDFFVDQKVPRDERNRIPLILSGDDIIWVVGHRADERFKVTEKTKRVVQLDVRKVRD
jgi:tRNA(Ile)-lysidine synthase